MGQFVAFSWHGGMMAPPAPFLARAAAAAGWPACHHGPGLLICSGGVRPTPVQVRGQGRLVVVGDLFEARDADLDEEASPLQAARRLVDHSWGRYVALFRRTPGQALTHVLRDPSGALDCAVWTDGPMTVVASCLPLWLIRAGGKAWRPDLDRVRDLLADPTLISGQIPLDGVASVAPGTCHHLDGRSETLWTPAMAARRASDPEPSPQTVLRLAVDRAVSAWSDQGPALVEVSGGLDSAIVASSRRLNRPDAPTAWVNSWGPFAEADERPYASAIASQLGVALTSIERAAPTDSSGLCLEHPPALRPSLNLMDAAYDRLQAELCRALNTPLVLSGKGGDVVFLQTATSAVLADALQGRGLLALRDPILPVLARRLRRSVWSVLIQGVTADVRPARHGGSGRPPLDHVSAEVRALRPPAHPWLVGLGGLPPGKRGQIEGLAENLSLHGLCHRTGAADLIHPLLSQPVMEACLTLSTPALTGGGHDRLLARQAFGDRLPSGVVARRSKGQLNALYGRTVAAGLADLRPHLLEGRLASLGLIDERTLAAALTPEALIWRGAGDLMILTVIEAWLQSWDRI